MVKKEIPNGSIRIRVKDLAPVRKNSRGYSDCKDYDNSNIKHTFKMYKHHKNHKLLIDSKDQLFLKGYLDKDGNVRGERIQTLPSGKKLDRAFSLFSPHLTIHDQTNNSHWDVIYQNPNGEFAYLYSEDKIRKSNMKKYELVDEFDLALPKLKRNVMKAIDNNEFISLPMLTLIKTYIRIGSEIYFKRNNHKGLVTLQKSNIKINKNNVLFDFISKDGVPQKIDLEFPEIYVKKLSKRLRSIDNESYVFCDNNGNKLIERDFHEAFKRYCSKEFYPHIVRSHFATSSVRRFLEKNKSPEKEDIIALYDNIAETLGHKKFSKKNNCWEPNHTVTVSHYVSPDLVDKLNKFVKNK